MEDKILKTLAEAGKPMKPGEIAELTGMEKKEVDKMIKKLKVAEKIYSPKRCYYDIKK
ncbi:MAG TPA: transcriptional regulator [Bacteroidetes bacterium]|nr:transcriptional regulator [Bacteroidota bacterium]